MKSFKEYVTMNEAFKKGDSVTIKNAKSYDAMMKDTAEGTVIGTMGSKVMVKVGSGQLNVDPKDLMLAEDKDEDEVELDESAKSEFISLNKGREGKTPIYEEGVEVRGAVYLGNGVMAKPSGSFVTIEGYLTNSGNYERFDLTKQAVKFLTKI